MVLRKKIFVTVCIALAGTLVIYFLFRDILLHRIIEHEAEKLKTEYSAQLNIGSAGFSGFKTVCITNLSLVPEQGDTLLTMDTLIVSPSLSSLLHFHLKLYSLVLNEGKLQLVCSNNSCNYSSFLKKKNSTPAKPAERNYARLFHNLYSRIFDFIPQEASIRSFSVSYQNDSTNERVYLQNYSNSKKKLAGELVDSVNAAAWKIGGSLVQNERLFDLKLYSSRGKHELPFLKSLINMSVEFDTLGISAEDNSYSGGTFSLNGKIISSNFSFHQPKLSDDAVFINHFNLSYALQTTESTVSLDSSSFLEMNLLTLHPFIQYTNTENKEYRLRLETDNAPANDFFPSLPKGMFDEIEGIEADGNLQYSLNFELNSAQPDSLQFSSEMKKEKFRLKKFGTNSLLKMNTEFSYTAYEHDRPFRTFMVGPSNPAFSPLESISPYLRNAILTSEDGSFFFHNGFNEDAFRKSIATNYEAGKFLRGGSTISMQLIKNIYLSRHKTVARKVEEALLVWLIESNRLCSKERMFEVYLNIIELGPGIYGVGEASEFYFNKKPSQLTLSESIFLASLLPHPKWFKYSFDEQGNLKSYLADYYRVVSNFLLKKNLITQEEYDAIQPNVQLKGIAKELVVPSDTIPQEEMEEDK